MRTLHGLRPPRCRGELRKDGRLQTVRFASARHPMPRQWVGKQVEVTAVDDEVVIAYDGGEIERHPLMAPGEISIRASVTGSAPGARCVRFASRPAPSVP